jgi:hypothetical protein
VSVLIDAILTTEKYLAPAFILRVGNIQDLNVESRGMVNVSEVYILFKTNSYSYFIISIS